MGVDLTRRTYSRKCRVFIDSDTEVSLRWYHCKPGAKMLPVASAINMRIWRRDQYAGSGIGEVATAAPSFQQVPRPLSAWGQGYCSPDPDWFRAGEPYRPLDPPAPRDEFGLLRCCAPFVTAGPGGLKWGGSAEVIPPIPDPPASWPCIDAVEVTDDSPIDSALEASTGQQWYYVAVTGASVVTVEAAADAPNLSFRIWYGTDCTAIVFVTEFVFGEGLVAVGPLPTTRVLVQFVNLTGAPAAFTFTIVVT